MPGIYQINTATLRPLYIYADGMLNALAKAKRHLRDKGHAMSVQHPRSSPKPLTLGQLKERPQILQQAWEFAQSSNERDTCQAVLTLASQVIRGPGHRQREFDEVAARLAAALN